MNHITYTSTVLHIELSTNVYIWPNLWYTCDGRPLRGLVERRSCTKVQQQLISNLPISGGLIILYQEVYSCQPSLVIRKSAQCPARPIYWAWGGVVLKRSDGRLKVAPLQRCYWVRYHTESTPHGSDARVFFDVFDVLWLTPIANAATLYNGAPIGTNGDL